MSSDVYIQGEWQLIVSWGACVWQDSSLLPLVWWQHLCWLLSAQLLVRSLTFPSEIEQQLLAECFATAFRIRITEHCYLWHKALWFFSHCSASVIHRRKILSREGLWIIGRPATWSAVPMPSVSPSILPACISYGLHVFDSLKEWFPKTEFIIAGLW